MGANETSLVSGFTFLWPQSSKSWDSVLCNYNIHIEMGGMGLALKIKDDEEEEEDCSLCWERCLGRAGAKQGVRNGISHPVHPPGSPQNITLCSKTSLPWQGLLRRANVKDGAEPQHPATVPMLPPKATEGS